MIRLRGALVFGVVLAVAWAPTAPAQLRASTCLAASALGNGSFEQPLITIGAQQVLEGAVAPWHTTATDGQIELWRSGAVQGIPAAAGNQLTEIAGTQTATTTYQDIPTTPGALLGYAFSHRGRIGEDTMDFQLGPPGLPANFTRRVTTGTAGWQQVVGEYTVPEGQTTTRVAFQWVATSNSSIANSGNLLDGVAVSTTVCSLAMTSSLSPPGDSGRFDLLIGDQIVAAATGDGATTGPLAMPLSAIKVSARAATGTDPGAHASAIRCRDRTTGELVGEAAGSELTVTYDRPRALECAVSHVRVPAVVVQKVLYPSDDPGRFDLRVGDQVVAAAAGDGTVAGPVDVDPGDVDVSERADGGTSAADYASAIRCATGVRQRRVAAFTPGTGVTVPVGAGSLVGCVLVNVHRHAPVPPEPEPAPQPPTPTPAPAAPTPTPVPAAGGDGEIDLALTTHPTHARVHAGSPARATVRVRNRGAIPATDVRFVLSARQAGTRVRAVRVTMAREHGPCAHAGGLAVCAIRQIGPGQTVTLRVSAGTRDLLARVRLVAVANAAEPERLVANNVARADVLMLRPPATPCSTAARAGSLLARIAC